MEQVCQNRPRCMYELASQTPTQGYNQPDECPLCGGELVPAHLNT